MSSRGFTRRVGVRDLDSFWPFGVRNRIRFSFSEQDLVPATGAAILDFLARLERDGADYEVEADTLVPCVFDEAQKEVLRQFKIATHETAQHCNGCTHLAGGQCVGLLRDSAPQMDDSLFSRISIDDVNYLARNATEEDKARLRAVIKHMYDAKAEEAREVFWTLPPWPRSTKLDYDFVFHYGEVMDSLNEDVRADTRFLDIIRRTYDRRKDYYFSKQSLEPRDNRWTKLIVLMCRTDLLSEEEREKWIQRYATYLFDDRFPKLPQAWNRVWALVYGLKVLTVHDLRRFPFVNYEEAEKIICSYVPDLRDLETHNFFIEPREWMLWKYLAIRRFCNRPILDELDKYLA